MRAVVYHGRDDVRVERVPDPILLAPTDALIRVRMSGICGTDIHLVHGNFPGMEPGTVLGHEFVGEVLEVGSLVRRVRVGEAVFGADFSSCGACWWCDRAEHWQCERRQFFGSGASFGEPLPGAQAEFVRVPYADVTLAALPPRCGDEAALLIGDNLATAWEAVVRAGVKGGDTVAIVGAGCVGQLVSLCAQVVGAGAVVVVEPRAQRREFAERQGALAATPEAALPLISELSRGRGADVVIEAVGGGGPMDAALSLVRRRGVVVSVGAHSAATWSFPLARAFAAELTVGFAIGDAIRHRQRLLALIEAGVLDPGVVVGERVPIEEAPLAYRRLAEQGILKAVISFA